MRILLEFLLVVVAATENLTVHSTSAQHNDRTRMGGIHGYSYNGGYRGLSVGLGFGKGGFSAAGEIHSGRYGGGGGGEAGVGYSATATAAGGGGEAGGGGGAGAGGYNPGRGAFGVGYGGSGYGNRYAYERGYGQQW